MMQRTEGGTPFAAAVLALLFSTLGAVGGAQATAKAPSMMVKRGGSAVADSRTGPRNRKANGFCNPPVRKISTASSAMSKAKSQAARSGSSRWVR